MQFDNLRDCVLSELIDRAIERRMMLDRFTMYAEPQYRKHGIEGLRDDIMEMHMSGVDINTVAKRLNTTIRVVTQVCKGCVECPLTVDGKRVPKNSDRGHKGRHKYDG